MCPDLETNKLIEKLHFSLSFPFISLVPISRCSLRNISFLFSERKTLKQPNTNLDINYHGNVKLQSIWASPTCDQLLIKSKSISINPHLASVSLKPAYVLQFHFTNFSQFHLRVVHNVMNWDETKKPTIFQCLSAKPVWRGLLWYKLPYRNTHWAIESIWAFQLRNFPLLSTSSIEVRGQQRDSDTDNDAEEHFVLCSRTLKMNGSSLPQAVVLLTYVA